MATKRLQKEYLNLQKAPLSHITFQLVDDDIHQWTATLQGPPSTPYADHTFQLSLVFPPTYPFKPPSITFVTPIYHPNVQTATGEICADLIGEGWGPTLNVRHCAELLQSMLENPEPDHPLEAEIAQLLREKPKEFEKKARAYTKEHATKVDGKKK